MERKWGRDRGGVFIKMDGPTRVFAGSLRLSPPVGHSDNLLVIQAVVR